MTNAPRLLVLCAPAGYGKGTFLRTLGTHAGRLICCDLADAPANGDLARPVLDALVAGDARRVARFAVDRLAWRAGSSTGSSREALHREWPRGGDPELFILRDVDAVLATPAGADLFAELVQALPRARTLVVSTRVPLPPALRLIVSSERAMTIGSADLALTPGTVAELAHGARLPSAAGTALYELARGWPLVTQLLVRALEHEARLTKALEDLKTLPFQTLLAFAAHRTIVRLDDTVRQALIVAVLLRGASHEQLVRILGGSCDDLVFAALSHLPFVLVDGEKVVVHSEIGRLLRARFASLVKAFCERTLQALVGEGRYVQAAQVALDGGDVERAAAIIDAAPPYTAAPVALAEYERVIERIDPALVTRFPNLWIATIPYRSFAVERSAFVREAETVYYCLPAAASADQRAAALMLLASAYLNAGRRSESDRLVKEALVGFAGKPTPARAAILNLSASIHGMEGRFAIARSLADEAASCSRDRFGENQTLHYIDAHEAAYRGQNERVVAIIDELLRRSENDELPLHRAHAATNGALFTWANGDDRAFHRYIELLEGTLSPGLERGFAPVVEAARGRPIRLDDGYPWPVVAAVAQLFRLGNATTREEALDAARIAARFADERRDPYTQLLAHAALHLLGSEPGREGALLHAIMASVESPEMRTAVAGLITARKPGILEPFLYRRVLRQDRSPVSRLRVELLGARVTRDGQPIHIPGKEFELLALLASARAPLSRDRIGEALWEQLEPEGWRNNLKVTLSRLRRDLDMRDVVVLADEQYKLSPLVDIDVRRAEAVVRECMSGPLDDDKRAELRALLAAVASGATSRYERFGWAQALLARIDDLVAGAGATLAKDALAQSQYDDALRYASQIAAADPFNEVACETAMRVLLGRGELDAARREFRRYAASLARELGATPSRHLAELVSTAK